MGVCVDANDCFEVENLISHRTCLQSIHLPAIPSLSRRRSMVMISIKAHSHRHYPQLQASVTFHLSQIF